MHDLSIFCNFMHALTFRWDIDDMAAYPNATSSKPGSHVIKIPSESLGMHEVARNQKIIHPIAIFK